MNQMNDAYYDDIAKSRAKCSVVLPGFGEFSSPTGGTAYDGYPEIYANSSSVSAKISKSEDTMNSLSREEINAKLAQNKAEVSSVSSDMKTEMANFRTAYVESFSEISKTLSRIESKADATEKRLTQAQWIVSLVISICAVTLSAVIYFSNKSNGNPPQQPQAQTQVASQDPSTETPKQQ